MKADKAIKHLDRVAAALNESGDILLTYKVHPDDAMAVAKNITDDVISLLVKRYTRTDPDGGGDIFSINDGKDFYVLALTKIEPPDLAKALSTDGS